MRTPTRALGWSMVGELGSSTEYRDLVEFAGP